MKTSSMQRPIFVEEARVLVQQSHPGHQYVLRLEAPQTASAAEPGSFIFLRCDPCLPMRRPMSIMRVDRTAGWIDVLYKIHGLGTELLASRRTGDTLNLLGPIGVPFKLAGYRHRPLLIGGGVGIPPMVFLTEHIKRQARSLAPLVLMGSEVPFPFKPRPSQFIVPGMPPEAIAAMPLMEDWGLPSRLASLKGLAGCFEGLVTDLARHWLEALSPEQRGEVEIFGCGPTPMLKAVAALAADYDLPCQLSLEEYMACAVGGCAGCTVRVRTEAGLTMKRVCVDGPVFEAGSVVF
jgi:dihydroorotate dehydrogenase electron transfer subunit